MDDAYNDGSKTFADPHTDGRIVQANNRRDVEGRQGRHGGIQPMQSSSAPGPGGPTVPYGSLAAPVDLNNPLLQMSIFSALQSQHHYHEQQQQQRQQQQQQQQRQRSQQVQHQRHLRRVPSQPDPELALSSTLQDMPSNSRPSGPNLEPWPANMMQFHPILNAAIGQSFPVPSHASFLPSIPQSGVNVVASMVRTERFVEQS